MAVQRTTLSLSIGCIALLLLISLELTNGQNMTFSCEENWCGEKWRSIDRILLYNYTNEMENITIVENRTYTKDDDCTPFEILLNICKKVNVTVEERTVIQVPRYTRNKQPLIKEIPQELKIQLIATENFASGIYNETTENYEPLADKVWQVWIPRGCRMVMFFTEFDLESSPNCSKDFFSIQTSKKQQNIVKYCGSVGEIANKTISIRNRRRVQMQFHSDESHTLRGVKAAYCFQDLKTYDPDVPCGCNADTSAIKRRHTRKAKGKGRPRTKSHSHSHTKSHTNSHTKSHSKSHSKSESSKHSKARLNKELLLTMQNDQDQRIAQIVKNMMQDGLRAINQYKYSDNRMERLLAEGYQRAMHSQAI